MSFLTLSGESINAAIKNIFYSKGDEIVEMNLKAMRAGNDNKF
jgi:Pyruvate/2-oxoacid:ferredoxin oxidoreductase gamma subunit